MSLFCPLCGKHKPEKALFCDVCKNKIEKEYEVDVPAKDNVAVTGEKIPAELKTVDNKYVVADKEGVLLADPLPESAKPRKNRRNLFIWVLILAVLLVGGFLYYGQVIRKSNLDRSQWDMALKENTVNGYLTYMQAFPKGKYYNLAEENLMKLKGNEAEVWKNLQKSENTAELRDFIALYPQSPYHPLIARRLDSLTWVATLNDNTAESYSAYMVMSQSGEFSGDYFGEAQERYGMLFQSYPVTQADLDSVKMAVEGFFSALSGVNANEISNYLAPSVFRFFNSGGGTREKIVGDLLISGARAQTPTIKYLPNMNAVAYEKTLIEHYKVNVPVQKSYAEAGQQKTVSGYIVHLELDRNFQIITITESKPTPDAV